MIDKSHLRTTMLALTEAELAQAHKTLNASLLPRGWIVLNRSRTTNRRRPKLPPIWQKRLMTLSTKRRPRLPQLQVWISARRPKLARCCGAHRRPLSGRRCIHRRIYLPGPEVYRHFPSRSDL